MPLYIEYFRYFLKLKDLDKKKKKKYERHVTVPRNYGSVSTKNLWKNKKKKIFKKSGL